ncbi:MarR family winged helix-turn-helix transcriptional regulator [Microlunatus soli]|uniref:MarR family winged helix-turn-helix transcriptional regulator n=1 Tax=Microlunatus soli TaxID=630515 RepID=UPI0018D40A4A|nr:MarR family transcriptional regulator [Microlunatus soli]
MGTEDPAPAAARAAATTELERELSLLFRSARHVSARMAARIHPELDAPGYGLLVAILEAQPSQHGSEEAGGVRAVELAGRTRLHKSTLSRSLGDLERLGLVARVRDPLDARARLVTLTERGRTAVEDSREARRQEMLRRLDSWDAEDLSQLAALLGRLSASLSADD